MATRLYITVTEILSEKQFELDTEVDVELPWHDFIKAINLHQILDRDYPDWQGYDINIDVEYDKEVYANEEVELPEIDLETEPSDVNS